MQLLSLIPILILLLYLMVSIDLEYTGLIPILILLFYLMVSIDLEYTGLCQSFSRRREQLYSKFYSNCSGAETTSSFSTYK